MPTMPSCAALRNRRRSVQLLFDHLVGAGKQRLREVEPEGSRRRKIDDELEFGRLLDRQIAGFAPRATWTRMSTIRSDIF